MKYSKDILSPYWANVNFNTNVRTSDGSMITDLEKTTYTFMKTNDIRDETYGPTFKLDYDELRLRIVVSMLG
jgi:hypothetical protein